MPGTFQIKRLKGRVFVHTPFPRPLPLPPDKQGPTLCSQKLINTSQFRDLPGTNEAKRL